MSVDVLSTLLRALSFVAMFQAVGVAIALTFLGRRLERALPSIRKLGFLAAIAGLSLVFAHYALEPARMAGDFSGVLDVTLQRLALESPLSIAAGLRVVGLALVAAGVRREKRIALSAAVIGGLGVIVSFTLVGHTAEASRTTWLKPLLAVHLLAAAFWFGGLGPLYIATREEPARRAAEVIAAFTRIATIVVPGLFAVGVLMTLVLVDAWSAFREGYGLLLLAKIAGFAALMPFAALNKWVYGPALASSAPRPAAFRRTIVIECALICAVLAVTAVMTTFFSP
ncbi:MAG TPA: CopD family protein [Steroidobacter sp.]|jgi:copper transport protein|nr:CopD family protein [Steroidobacter sp.]